MMGESRWHKLENQKNNTRQSCTLEQPGYHMIPYGTIWYHTVTIGYHMVPYGTV